MFPSEHYPFPNVEKTSINENCKTFRNWGVSDSEFMEYVHKEVEGTGYIKISTRRGRLLVGGDVIMTAIVYYEKENK